MGNPSYSIEFEFFNICGGSKDDSPGKIISPRSGYIISMVLSHSPCSDSKPEECQVSCNSKVSTLSYWSCNDVNKNKLNVYISDQNRKELFPGPRKYSVSRYGFYKYGKDFGASNPTLVFNDTGCPRVRVEQGDELQIWYGEDFFDIGERDNMGNICADVTIKYKDIAAVENPSRRTGGTASRVCYEPSNNGYGVYRNQNQGYIKEIDLTRSCGSIPCNGDGDENHGCYDKTEITDLSGISIYNEDGETNALPHAKRKEKHVDGMSSTIEFVEECPNVKKNVGEKLQLRDTGSNHVGYHHYVCFNVFAKEFPEYCALDPR